MVDVESVLAITFLFGGGSLVGISYSPIGKAIADRVRHGKSPLPAAEPDAAVYEELDHLRADSILRSGSWPSPVQRPATEVQVGPDGQLIIIVVTLVCGTVLLQQIVRALIRRFEHRELPDAVAEEVAQLRDRLAEMESTVMRVPELEERVDFAERLLASRDERASLPRERTPV